MDPMHELAFGKLRAHAPDLSSFAAHSGWLRKRGTINVEFKRRYFTLHGAYLSYYESEDDAKASASAPQGKGSTKASDKAKGHVAVSATGHASFSDAPEMSDPAVLTP